MVADIWKVNLTLSRVLLRVHVVDHEEKSHRSKRRKAAQILG